MSIWNFLREIYHPKCPGDLNIEPPTVLLAAIFDFVRVGLSQPSIQSGVFDNDKATDTEVPVAVAIIQIDLFQVHVDELVEALNALASCESIWLCVHTVVNKTVNS